MSHSWRSAIRRAFGNHWADRLDIGDSSESTATIANDTARARDRLEADVLATLRVRAGLAVDQTLFYGPVVVPIRTQR
jgi:hypothetical protein